MTYAKSTAQESPQKMREAYAESTAQISHPKLKNLVFNATDD